MCLNKTTYFLIQHIRKLELKSTICNKIWKLEVEETHFEMEREFPSNMLPVCGVRERKTVKRSVNLFGAEIRKRKKMF